MLFTIQNRAHLTTEHLRTNTLLAAYYIIQKYPMHVSDNLLDRYIQQQYGTTLKNMCIKLILSLTFHKDNKGNLILLFKDPKYDQIARLITYGNGIIPGSAILQTALTE